MTVEYVVGFASSKTKRIALIRKNRPDWQAGLLNGIGGKVEDGETPYNAMIREFEEEAGVKLGGWLKIATIDYEDFIVHFYALNNLEDSLLDSFRSMTDEKLFFTSFDDVPKLYYNMVSGLQWLIPLSLYENDYYYPIELEASTT